MRYSYSERSVKRGYSWENTNPVSATPEKTVEADVAVIGAGIAGAGVGASMNGFLIKNNYENTVEAGLKDITVNTNNNINIASSSVLDSENALLSGGITGVGANISVNVIINSIDSTVNSYIDDTVITKAGDITLSESAANYNVIEIFYKSSDSVYLNTGKIYSPNGKNVGLYAPYSIGTTCYSKQARVNINGTAITMSNEIETQLWASNEKVAINTPSSGNHYFTIEKVIGYK